MIYHIHQHSPVTPSGRTTYLHKCRLEFHCLLPTSGPQVISSEPPIFSILRKAGVKPWRNAHHVWLPAQGCLPSHVGCCVFPHRAMRPCVPAEGPIDIFLRNPPRRAARPIGHKKAVGIRLDCCPVSGRISSLEGGNQWFIIISILRRPSFGSKIFNRRGHSAGIPRDASSQIIKRQKKSKFLDPVGCVCGQIDLGSGIVILGANIQSESVDASVLGLGDVVDPVIDSVGRNISDLYH